MREGDTASYVVGLSALAPTGGVQIRVVKKSGADPSFRIDADPATDGDQDTLTIPAGQNEGTVDVHADADTDSVAGSMDVFHIVTTAGQPRATGTITVREIESRLELPAVEDQSFELGIAHTVTLPAATGGVSPLPVCTGLPAVARELRACLRAHHPGAGRDPKRRVSRRRMRLLRDRRKQREGRAGVHRDRRRSVIRSTPP